MSLLRAIVLYFTLLFAFVHSVKGVESDSTTIYGCAPQYAGLHLALEYKSNVLTNENEQLVSFLVGSDGTFKTSFNLKNTTKLSIKLGKTIGSIVIQPKGSYRVELPRYTPLEESDRMNPFFVPDIIPLAISSGDINQLNRSVALFDDEFNTLYVNNLQKLFKRENETPILKITTYLDSVYSSNDVWFTNYRHFTYYKLYELVFPRRREYIIDKFFKSSPFMPNNAAFVDAFNLAFFRYFSLKLSSKSSITLRNAWQSRSIDSISNVMKDEKIILDDQLREAVILKNLFDSYYSNLYDKDEILSLIKQCESSFKTDYCSSLAKQLSIKLPLLKVGSTPPNFKLESLTGKSKSLRDFKGKFVYLNFMNTQNYACKKDLLALLEINKATKKELVMVTILTDKNLDSAKDFIKNNRLDWTFLSINSQESLIDDYKLRVLPTYFLIDPEGKFNMSPAPAPDEGFLSTFQNQYRSFRNQDLRANPPKQKSIFDM